jgi:Tfp pilus assembly protein PilN
MIKINLIPPETLEREVRKRFLLLISLAGGTLITLAIFFSLIRFTVDGALALRLNNLELQIKKYQSTVDEVKKLRDLTASLEARKNVIENLMKGRINYPKYMEDFLPMLPSAIWLTSLNTQNTPDGFSITMTCMSYDSMSIADFISNLETNPRYAGIDLGAITSSGGKPEMFSFQIRSQYKVPRE